MTKRLLTTLFVLTVFSGVAIAADAPMVSPTPTPQLVASDDGMGLLIELPKSVTKSEFKRDNSFHPVSTPTPILIANGGGPTPTPTCPYPNDNDCDGFPDIFDNDDDNDGFMDNWDPNPLTCDPCLRANTWDLNLIYGGNWYDGSHTINICGNDDSFDLDFWWWHTNNGYESTSCNFLYCTAPPLIQWAVSPGNNGDEWEMQGMTTISSLHSIYFFKPGTYTITATHPGWSTGNDCDPISGQCGWSILSANGGSDTFTATITAPAIFRDITFSRNAGISGYSTTTLDNDLHNGYLGLRIDSDGISSYDVPCCAKIRRIGTVNVINDPALAVINTSIEYGNLLNYNFEFNFVESLLYNPEGGGYVGFCDPVGRQITCNWSIGFDTSKRANLIYHEYGHRALLNHNNKISGDLMYNSLPYAGWRTTKIECSKLVTY